MSVLKRSSKKTFQRLSLFVKRTKPDRRATDAAAKASTPRASPLGRPGPIRLFLGFPPFP